MKNYIKKLKDRILRKIFISIYKPGHYYSQIPSLEEINKREGHIFDTQKKEIQGVNIYEKEQLELLEKLKVYYEEVLYNKDFPNRYYYKNIFFNDTDAIILYGIIRTFSPKKIIEIGSGFSSAVILDTNEFFFKNKITCTFVEPYPDRLLSLLKKEETNCSIMREFVQDVDLNLFKELEANDILFIDSSHVSKIGSDVNFLFFEVLPVLKKGVIVHIHDICFPFEYPQSWINQGIFWNEAYLLRSFLMFNNTYKILLFNNFLSKFHSKWFINNMPSCSQEGGSFWMVKE
jgi:predicted O-methyltransferase YrrM